ncbi:hypothetical protein [Leptospira noguchii]|nr:hypothetical protein [Leptospira noguchii]UOG31341.1 hypothetical protein MAL06_04710 [Leptospira noguchii]UOG51860.1 hypothetical protein MAL09_14570 [Leptospira noguchii]
MKFKSKYRIKFLLYNLLTRAESPVRLPMASRIRPVFLRRIYIRVVESGD